MSTALNLKIQSFKSYLRSKLTEKTLSNTLYKASTVVAPSDEGAFINFLLKLLLERIDDLEAAANPSAPASDRAAPEFGYRTATPVPAGGIQAIKAGSLDDLDADEMITEVLPSALRLWEQSVSKNSDAVMALSTLDPLTVSLDELARVAYTPAGDVYTSMSYKFRISHYLKESDAILIGRDTRENIAMMHEHCVVPTFIYFFQNLYTDPECTTPLDSEDTLTVFRAIKPFATDSEFDTPEYKCLSQTGHYVELRVANGPYYYLKTAVIPNVNKDFELDTDRNPKFEAALDGESVYIPYQDSDGSTVILYDPADEKSKFAIVAVAEHAIEYTSPIHAKIIVDPDTELVNFNYAGKSEYRVFMLDTDSETLIRARPKRKEIDPDDPESSEDSAPFIRVKTSEVSEYDAGFLEELNSDILSDDYSVEAKDDGKTLICTFHRTYR